MPDPLIDRRLGRYQIHEEIGRGGMARVYRATDTLLQRPVAIKLLAPHLSDDSEFARRFEREAITAANLRHPAIITIFDVGQVDGFHYIAMEYIAGCTLHDVITARGKLGLSLSVAVLAPVADALHYAHTRGAIHRDVKPHNILIDTDGRVLLTDFGIALGPRTSADRLTQAGSFMGTPEYLSPEQVQEQPLTGRCDQYALAIVAFETLTGRVPFQGATPQLIIAHLYTSPPRVSLLDPLLPPEIDPVLDRALAKEPSARFASAVAFVEALREVSVSHGMPPVRPDAIAALARPVGSSAGQDTIALPQAAGSAAAKQQAFPHADSLGVPPATPLREQPPAPPQAIARKPSIPIAAPQVSAPDLSPATAPVDGVQRPPRRFTSRRLIRPWIPMDEGGAARTPRSGGRRSQGFAAPVAMVVLLLVGMSGLFLYQGFRARAQAPTDSGGLGAVFAATATPELSPAGAVASPAPAPAVLPTMTPNSVPPPTAEAAPTTPAATSAAATSTLKADLIGGGATIVFQAGVALNLLDAGIETISQISGDAQPAGPAAISPDGKLVLFDTPVEGKRRIFSYDRTTGDIEQYVPGDDEAFHPFWAPDGSRVVYAAVHEGNTDIWELDVRNRTVERLTDDPAEDDYPSYGRDGSEIVWERKRPEGWRIFSMNRDGERRIVDPLGNADDRYPRISPDGNRLVFASSRGRVDGGLDLYMLPIDGGTAVRLTDPRRGSAQGPQWSPDGKMLVFFSDPAGNDDIFTLHLAELERITAITHTAEDERWPTWGP